MPRVIIEYGRNDEGDLAVQRVEVATASGAVRRTTHVTDAMDAEGLAKALDASVAAVSAANAKLGAKRLPPILI